MLSTLYFDVFTKIAGRPPEVEDDLWNGFEMNLKLSSFIMESRGWFGLSQDSLISAKSISCSFMKVLNSLILLYSDLGLTTNTFGSVIAVIKLLFLFMVIRHLGAFAARPELDSDFLLQAEKL